MSDHTEPLPEGDEAAPKGARAMAVFRWGLVGAMALLALASFGHWYQTRAQATGTTSAGQYYCPMHPSVVSDRPSSCPICSMDLVLREPETAADTASEVPGVGPVTLTPDRIALMGMKTAFVTKEALLSELHTIGFVAAREDGQAQVVTRFSGFIEELLVASTGQRVSKGQVLATIYSPELLTAQQDLLSARAWTHGVDHPGPSPAPVPGPSPASDDGRRRLELLGIAPSEIDELIVSGVPVRAMKLRSPVSGHVIEKSAIQGGSVQAGSVLFLVADLSTVWVLADLYEYDVARVRVEQNARFELASYPGETFVGSVRFIYPTVDPKTRTLRLRLELKNPNLKLLPGMYGDVRVELPSAVGLAVPIEAAIDTGDAQYVFVALPDGRFEPHKVRFGVESADKIQVLFGLNEGDVVVTTGNFLLDSESRLRAAISGPKSKTQSEGHNGHSHH